MNGQIEDGQIDEWIDRGMDRQRMDGWMDRQMNRQIEDGQIDEWIDRGMDRQRMDGWMDKQVNEQIADRWMNGQIAEWMPGYRTHSDLYV